MVIIGLKLGKAKFHKKLFLYFFFKSSRRESGDDQILGSATSRPSSVEPSCVFSQTSLVL